MLADRTGVPATKERDKKERGKKRVREKNEPGLAGSFSDFQRAEATQRLGNAAA